MENYGCKDYKVTYIFNTKLYTPSCLWNLVQPYIVTRTVQLKRKEHTLVSLSQMTLCFCTKILQAFQFDCCRLYFHSYNFVASLNHVCVNSKLSTPSTSVLGLLLRLFVICLIKKFLCFQSTAAKWLIYVSPPTKSTLIGTSIACLYCYARSQHKAVFTMPLRPAVTVLTVYRNYWTKLWECFSGPAATYAKDVSTAVVHCADDLFFCS